MKTIYKVLIAIVILLVGFRIYLPYLVTDYVNNSLQEIPDYTGGITDVDIHLYRGAYVIDSLKILKVEGDVPVPFVAIDRVDLSVEWGALFKGAITGEIHLTNPELNFVTSRDTANAQNGENVDWTKPIKELMPLKINVFSTTNGTIHYRDYESEPAVDVFIKNLDLRAENLSNVEYEGDTLPSSLRATGTSLGGGKLLIHGGLNLVKQVPDADLELEFEGVDITSLNDFLEAYAKIDAEAGTFFLYSEVVIKDGLMEGYVKPVIRDLKVVNLEDEDKPFIKAWEVVAGGVAELFENQPEDQVASRIPLEGDLNKPDTKVLPTIWAVFSNAFIEAFSLETDDQINFSADSEQGGEGG